MRILGWTIVRTKTFKKLTESHTIGRLQYSGETFENYLGSLDLLEHQVNEIKVEAKGKLTKLVKQLGETQVFNSEAARVIKKLLQERNDYKKELKVVSKQLRRYKRIANKNLRRVV